MSGLMGREEAVSAADTTTYELDQSVVAVDLSLPLADTVTLKGQYFKGSNLAQYLGGVGQGIAEIPAEGAGRTELVEVEASGWWAQLTVKPNQSWQFNVGAGSDDPELDEDDTAGNDLEKNTTYFGNAIWTVTPSAVVGFEYAMIETEYMVRGEEETTTESYQNNRLQLSFMYKF